MKKGYVVCVCANGFGLPYDELVPICGSKMRAKSKQNKKKHLMIGFPFSTVLLLTSLNQNTAPTQTLVEQNAKSSLKRM